jgi:hypothetical protein
VQQYPVNGYRIITVILKVPQTHLLVGAFAPLLTNYEFLRSANTANDQIHVTRQMVTGSIV